MKIVLHHDRPRALSFGQDAARYDRARPSYPAALIDALLAEKVASVLDVGCGTGKAARLLAARGAPVLGIEPDERMAAVARSFGIPVEVATFEEWDAAGRRFDLVVAGQAWHWIDPLAGPRKAAALLPSRGRLAVFWNVGSHDSVARVQIDEAYRTFAPALEKGYVPLGHARAGNVQHMAAIAATELFEEPELRSYAWKQRYRRDQWLDQLGTHSEHLLLPPAQFTTLAAAIGSVIDQLGGSITVHYQTDLIVARRR
jgi:SAM-dependent methyltransferase